MLGLLAGALTVAVCALFLILKQFVTPSYGEDSMKAVQGAP